MTEAVDLAARARTDWTALVRGIASAGALVSGGAERSPAMVMVERMLIRAAKEGAQALAWSGTPVNIEKLVVGAGRSGRTDFVALAALADAPAEIPVSLAQVARAFPGDDERPAALVAMFLDAGRRAETLVEQLHLASQGEAGVGEAAVSLERSLARAHLVVFKPRLRSVADFDRMRAVGYLDTTAGATAGRVAAVERPGLAWHANVLRKADVIVFDKSS